MFDRAFIVCVCSFIFFGCAHNDELAPKIVHSPTNQGLTNIQNIAPAYQRTQKNFDDSISRDWIPPLDLERKWTAIVIHHSGTETGNAAIFDKWHRQGNHWEGVGYDFVIGNGTNSLDGQVEVTFRWRQQRTGAHCKTPDNWANETAVGICLVGDFNYTLPTTKQMSSLVKLTRFLQKRYRIPNIRIYGHNTTPGARITACPGKKFPMAWFKSRLGL